LNKEGKDITKKISKRVLDSISKEGSDVSKLIEESINTEKKLIKYEKKNKSVVFEKLKFIKKLKSALRKKEDKEKLKNEIKKIAKYYSDEIHGNLNKFLFSFIGVITPTILNFMLHSFSIIQFLKNFRGTKELNNRVIVKGNVDLIKNLQKKGSLVFVPTHISNFDSVVLGHVIHKLRLNPPLWGAGLNLLKGITISYIMNNVGCYKVDRRKKNKIYLKTLQEYSTCTIEEGRNTLFYPSGTRSRSGDIEKNLKLGLLKTVVSAFLNNIKKGSKKSKVYVVPIAMSYTVVPEAEELALEHYFGAQKKEKILKKIFKKTTSFGRTIKTIWNNLMRDNPIYLTFGQAIDPLGNKVNSKGDSIDKNGIPINLETFTKDSQGNYLEDEKTKKYYTKNLSELISKSFIELNTVLSTQVFLYSIINFLKDKNKIKEETELINLEPHKNSISKEDLKKYIAKTIQKIKTKIPEANLDHNIEKEDIESIIKKGIEIYKSNYASRVIELKNNYLIPKKIATILYYSSRLRIYLN
jgi:glycerol-3-phosphate O-acyltransferase